MKKNNKKLITLMLAGAVGCTAILGAALIKNPVQTSAAETKYSLTDIFSSNASNAIGAEKQNSEDSEQTTAFTLADGEYVRFKNDLAFKWFKEDPDNKGKGLAQYLSVDFSFKNLDFDTVTVKVENESSLATESEKTANSVVFKNNDGVISVAVVSDGAKESEAVYTTTSIAANTAIQLRLAEDEDEAYDSFSVYLNDGTDDLDIGTFTHMGANHGDYQYAEASNEKESMYPLQIKVEAAKDKKAVVYLDQINGQRFDNVVEDSGVKKVKDTAAPVLVVNEDVNSFMLGAAFSLQYEKIDVLQKSSLTESKKYYQYNPADKKPEYDSTSTTYNDTLTTSTYFLSTVYYVDGQGNVVDADTEGCKPTSVYQEMGAEYVAIRFTLGDNAFNVSGSGKEYSKAVYDLSWYAEADAVKTFSWGEGEDQISENFIVVDRNTEGPSYKYIVAKDGKNVLVNENGEEDESVLENLVEEYNAQLATAAEAVYGGSNDYIYFPSMDWLLDDNNGYRNLKFTVCYKTATKSSQSSSNLSYNGLKLSASEEGLYEFKILATDEAGNAMRYYLDEELVDVTSSNIWDIEEIPSFSYEIKNQGIKIKNEDDEDDTDRMDTQILNETYTLSGITTLGGSNQQTAYALYTVNLDAYNKSLADGATALEQKHLVAITYKTLREAIASELGSVKDKYDGNYFDMYIDVYAGLLAKEVDGDKAKIKTCFQSVDPYNEKITESDAGWENNQLEWQKSSENSFLTAEEGEYLILVDYWDSLLPTVSRAAAYKLIVVESEADVIKGETEWLKNNIVSVILFSVAAVLLILIIILLLIKPSDETLEDVDAKATTKKKAKKSAKKSNK